MQQNRHAIHRKITLSRTLASNLNYSRLALGSAVYSLPLLHFPYTTLSKTLNLFSLINFNNNIYLSLLVYLFHLGKFWGQGLHQSPWDNVITSSPGSWVETCLFLLLLLLLMLPPPIIIVPYLFTVKKKKKQIKQLYFSKYNIRLWD